MPQRKARKVRKKAKKEPNVFRYGRQHGRSDPYFATLNNIQQQAHAGQVNSLIRELKASQDFARRARQEAIEEIYAPVRPMDVDDRPVQPVAIQRNVETHATEPMDIGPIDVGPMDTAPMDIGPTPAAATPQGGNTNHPRVPTRSRRTQTPVIPSRSTPKLRSTPTQTDSQTPSIPSRSTLTQTDSQTKPRRYTRAEKGKGLANPSQVDGLRSRGSTYVEPSIPGPSVLHGWDPFIFQSEGNQPADGRHEAYARFHTNNLRLRSQIKARPRPTSTNFQRGNYADEYQPTTRDNKSRRLIATFEKPTVGPIGSDSRFNPISRRGELSAPQLYQFPQPQLLQNFSLGTT